MTWGKLLNSVALEAHTLTGFLPYQEEIISSAARFRVVCAGRRIGKTVLGVGEAIATAIPGGYVWWVAPSYKLASVGWRRLRRIARLIPGSVESLTDKLIHLPGGGYVQVRTAGEKGGLRGEGLDLVVYDECAQGDEWSWTEELRATLSDRKGRALFLSTPKGRANWFYRLWLQGNGEDPDWRSWQLPTATNPEIDPAEIEAARAVLPLDVFEQEYLAMFNDAGSTVFRPQDIAAMADGWRGFSDSAVHSGQVLHSWDIGRRADPTVGFTIDYSNVPYQIIAFSHDTRMPYPEQQIQIARRHRQYGGRTYVESNGPGDSVIENLSIRADPFVMTQRSKVQAIQSLQALLERGGLKGDIPKLTRELTAYEWDDKHLVQDCVMSLAIAAYHLPTLEARDFDYTIDDELFATDFGNPLGQEY